MRSDDVVEIVATTHRYAFAVDGLQWALFDDVFTEDVEADFGGGAVWHGRASLKQDFAAVHASFEATQHVTTNHNVTVDGDTANCLSYVLGNFIRELGGDNLYQSGGWYDDTLVRTSDGWRIRTRVCRQVWWKGNPRVMRPDIERPVESRSDPVSRAAAEGRLAYLAALQRGPRAG